MINFAYRPDSDRGRGLLSFVQGSYTEGDGGSQDMKTIYAILLFCCFALGLYFLAKNPRWMMDLEHVSALGIGAVFGFLLGRFFP